MRPGTSPRTEYEYGKDMMAKQMYSENNSAAVYRIVRMWSQHYTCEVSIATVATERIRLSATVRRRLS